MELSKEENIKGVEKLMVVNGHNDIAEFLNGVKKLSDEYMESNFPSLDKHGFECSWGPKYVKVFSVEYRNSSYYSRHVYCFIDRYTGDIYKAASWNKPAKHVRGNIFADDKGLSCCTPYGIKYLVGGIF